MIKSTETRNIFERQKRKFYPLQFKRIKTPIPFWKIKDNLKRLILVLIVLLGSKMTAEETEYFNIFLQNDDEPYYQDFSMCSDYPPDMTASLPWKHSYKKIYYSYLLGIFIVSKDGEKYGLVDEKNTSITPLRYDEMDYFTYPDKIIWAKENGKWGALNYKGETLIPFVYDNIKIPNSSWYFPVSLYAVESKGKWGFVDKNNKTVVPLIYDDVNSSFRGYPTMNYTEVKQENKWGAINKEGKLTVPIIYNHLRYSRNNQYIAEKDGKRGVISVENEIIIPVEYDAIYPLKDKEIVYTVVLDGLTGYIDNKGTVLSLPRYKKAKDFCKGLAEVSENGKWGIIDEKGNLLLPCKYKTIKRFLFYDLIFVCENNKWGVISNEGKEIVPCEYYYIKDLEYPDTTIKAYSCGQSFEIDFTGKVLK
ncbi:WG repeat-containing protein [Treponema pedis]|nr:WG repeat-containing protein [Treponema pedis]QSI05303.1 WG repeat-containing protein [Treponema pedis]